MSESLPQLPSSPELRASWRRSQGHGLSPEQGLPDSILSRADFADRVEA
jgi:transcriptional regulator of acetoin/glycerol metabolism